MLFGQQAADAECYVMAVGRRRALRRPCVTQAASLDRRRRLADRQAPGRDRLRHRSRCRCRPCCRCPTRSTSRATRRCPRSWAPSASRTRCWRWRTPASTPARSAQAGAKTTVEGLSTPPARGDGVKIEDSRRRRREDPGLPRRAEAGGLMAGIGVFCELQDGEFTKGSLGLLAEAARLGGELGEPVHALVTGEVVRRRGRRARRPRRQRRPRRRGRGAGGLCAAGRRRGRRAAGGDDFRYVLFGASIVASDAAAGIAVRLDAGLVIDAVELQAEGGKLVTRRAGLGDSVLAHCGFTTPVGVVVVRANTFAARRGRLGHRAGRPHAAGRAGLVARRADRRPRGGRPGGRRHRRGRRPRRAAAADSASPRTSRSARSSPRRSAAPSRPRARSSTPAGTRTPRRSARRASR